MNRYIRAATAAMLMVSGLGSMGCKCGGGGRDREDGGRLTNCYDTAWPDRYNHDARQAVVAPFAQQAANGHFMEQTIWNWYFEPGTDKLNGAGLEKLNSLSRVTPGPDPKIYLQTARDVIVVAGETPEQLATKRNELTAKRAEVVRGYLSAQPGAPVDYEILAHDAAPTGIYAPFATTAFRGQQFGYTGGLLFGGGAGGGQAGGGVQGQGFGGQGQPTGGAGVNAAIGAGAVPTGIPGGGVQNPQ